MSGRRCGASLLDDDLATLAYFSLHSGSDGARRSVGNAQRNLVLELQVYPGQFNEVIFGNSGQKKLRIKQAG